MSFPVPETPVVDTSRSPYAKLRPIGVGDVQVRDSFWQPLIERNRAETLPAQHAQCVSTGAFENFRRAAGAVDGPFNGRYYSDSDVYKWAEAVSWSLADKANPELEAKLNAAIELFAGAQGEDGYLNTYFSVDRVAERWTDLVVRHEMYCIGHLVQAAVAHLRATGRRQLVDIAVRACEHIFERFAPEQVPGTCGHPCLEMALVELYRATDERRWLELAGWQLDSRGRGVLDGGEYLLDHAPAREQTYATGHAVRALYLYAAMVDVVLETGDEQLRSAVDELWDDISKRKTAVTGGIGARWDGEAFGDAYELPDRAYNETCAAIAHIFLAWRLLLLTGDGKYRDAMETALYNGVLPGLAGSGTEFFYQNPLADAGRHRRQPWFECACCPPNIARLLASLTGYAYTTDDDGVSVQLYLGGEAKLRLADGSALLLDVTAGLPWQGTVDIDVRPERPTNFELRLPAPAWTGAIEVTVNGTVVRPMSRSGYLVVDRIWEAGDSVRVGFELPTRLVTTHPRVTAGHQRVALLRGPLVYCVEQVDHDDVEVADLRLTGAEDWKPVQQPDLLGGVHTLTTDGTAVTPQDDALYREYVPDLDLDATDALRPVEITAIPYFAWANREPGPMRVFLPLAGGRR